MDTGESSLYLKYGMGGETCVFVAVDVRTGVFKTFKLWKDPSSPSVVVKSVASAPNTLYNFQILNY